MKNQNYCELIHPEIIKEYDIRSKVGTRLNKNTYYFLGVAIVLEMQELYSLQTIIVGYDSRSTSYIFAQYLEKGLQSTGIKVIDIGCLPTPVLHFAMYYFDCFSSLMITASHNPIEYNGLKITLAGKNYHGNLLQEFYQRMISRSPSIYENSPPMTSLTRYSTKKMIKHYIDKVKQDIAIQRPLRIVVDCGNAVAGKVVPDLLTALGCEVIPLYCDVLDTFPNHHPDPVVEENLLDLSLLVREKKADLGVAFDGDGDRLGVVDNNGAIIASDRLLIAFSEQVLDVYPKTVIVFDVKCTQHLNYFIQERGGQAIMSKTGMSNIMDSMLVNNAVLGGEYCGHFYFWDRWLDFDDGIYAAARLVELLNQHHTTTDAFFSRFPCPISTAEIKIPIAEAEKEHFMKQIIQQGTSYEKECICTDGLRVIFTHGWGLIRASNTTPCLTLRFEADNSLHLEQIKSFFRDMIWSIDPNLNLSF